MTTARRQQPLAARRRGARGSGGEVRAGFLPYRGLEATASAEAAGFIPGASMGRLRKKTARRRKPLAAWRRGARGSGGEVRAGFLPNRGLKAAASAEAAGFIPRAPSTGAVGRRPSAGESPSPHGGEGRAAAGVRSVFSRRGFSRTAA